MQTESRKRKRKVEDDEQEERDSNSEGSAQRCPTKKHECHLYELYRSKWWVQCFYWNKRLILKSGCKVKAWVLWLELIAVHILNFSVDSLKMRTINECHQNVLLTVQEETETSTCIHFLPLLCSFPCTFLPFSTIPPFCLFLILFSLFVPSFHLPFCFPLLISSLQSSLVAEKPRCVLCSAGSGLQPRWPAVVQLHTAGPTNPGEPPHQNPPRQGHLLRQTTSGGKHGGKHGGRGWGWNSWRGVAVAWTSVRRVCKDGRGGGHVGYIVECVLFTCLIF